MEARAASDPSQEHYPHQPQPFHALPKTGSGLHLPMRDVISTSAAGMQSQWQHSEQSQPHEGSEAPPQSQAHLPAEIRVCGALLQQRTWVPHDSLLTQGLHQGPPEPHKADKPIQHSLGSQKDRLGNVVWAPVTQKLQQSEECPRWADGTDEPREAQKGQQP